MLIKVEAEKDQEVGKLQSEIDKIEGDIEAYQEKIQKLKDKKLTDAEIQQYRELEEFQRESKEIESQARKNCREVIVNDAQQKRRVYEMQREINDHGYL